MCGLTPLDQFAVSGSVTDSVKIVQLNLSGRKMGSQGRKTMGFVTLLFGLCCLLYWSAVGCR